MFLLPLNIHILQPVENVALASDVDLVDSFIKKGFCQGYTPTPLEDNRDKFLHLVGDIQNRKDDYAAQLSSLTIAAMSNTDKSQVESKNEIISSLIGGKSLPEKEESEDNTDLWQARLMLKLAEMLDKEEEELSRNLSILEDYEAELLQELQGESGDDEENPFADLQQLKKNMVSQRTGAMKNRLKAWSQLTEDSTEIKEIRVFITDSVDATELLLEAYHEIEEKMPDCAFTFSLPPITSWDASEAVEKVITFKEQFDSYNDFAELIAKDGEDHTVIEKWNEAIEHAFPRDSFGIKTVSVYKFPGYSCSDLLKNTPNKTSETGVLIAIGNHE